MVHTKHFVRRCVLAVPMPSRGPAVAVAVVMASSVSAVAVVRQPFSLFGDGKQRLRSCGSSLAFFFFVVASGLRLRLVCPAVWVMCNL